MKNLPNIEKSRFRPGEYVGYAHGTWNIAPCQTFYGHKKPAHWAAEKRDASAGGMPADYPTLYGRTLAEISEKLEKIASALPLRRGEV